jgi:hypothetical protein
MNALPPAIDEDDDPFVLDLQLSASPVGAELVPIVIEPDPAPRHTAANDRYALDNSASSRRALFVFAALAVVMLVGWAVALILHT